MLFRSSGGDRGRRLERRSRADNLAALPISAAVQLRDVVRQATPVT